MERNKKIVVYLVVAVFVAFTTTSVVMGDSRAALTAARSFFSGSGPEIVEEKVLPGREEYRVGDLLIELHRPSGDTTEEFIIVAPKSMVGAPGGAQTPSVAPPPPGSGLGVSPGAGGFSFEGEVLPKEKNICSPLELVGSTLPRSDYQEWPDMGGRYIVWTERDGSPDQFIRGYDLGLDERFDTADDRGTNTLYSSILYFGMGGATFMSKVNTDGLVSFVRTVSAPQVEVQLVTCAFDNCRSTIEVVDTIPISILPDGQIQSMDLNETSLVYVIDSLSQNFTHFIHYDLATKRKTLLREHDYSTISDMHTAHSLRIEGGDVVSWNEMSGNIPAGETTETFYLQKSFVPDSAVAIDETHVSEGISGNSVGTFYSYSSTMYDSNVFALYPQLDGFPAYDLVYKILPFEQHATAITQTFGKDDLFPRGVVDPETGTLLLAYSQYFPTPGLFVEAFNPHTQTFVPHKTTVIPDGWEELGVLEFSEVGNITGMVIRKNGEDFGKLFITNCAN